MWIPVYIARDPHFPALRHFIGTLEYVDSCLYMEGFTFLYIQPFDIHRIRTILDQLYLIETTRSQMTRSPLMKNQTRFMFYPRKTRKQFYKMAAKERFMETC